MFLAKVLRRMEKKKFPNFAGFAAWREKIRVRALYETLRLGAFAGDILLSSHCVLATMLHRRLG
jgi:hypothetical protein